MMNMLPLGKQTFYLPNATNIGVYQVNEKEIVLIDSGNDSDAGKKILKAVEEKGYKVLAILNTHSHADHIGGNHLIQSRCGCKIYAYGLEKDFIANPELESNILYGAFPYQKMQNKFLCAKKSEVESIEGNLPDGLEMLHLPGHCYDMVGFKTKDDVYFLGDALVSEETISKYSIFYLYDIQKHLETLDYLQTLQGEVFVCSHVEPLRDLHDLIRINREKIDEILHLILKLCQEPKTMEELLKEVMDSYHLTMNENQFFIVGSTLRSYVSYLCNLGKIKYFFQDCFMYWQTIGE